MRTSEKNFLIAAIIVTLTYVLTVRNQSNIRVMSMHFKWLIPPISTPAGFVTFANVQTNLMKCKFLNVAICTDHCIVLCIILKSLTHPLCIARPVVVYERGGPQKLL